METKLPYVGKPRLFMQRSKTGKSTSLHWDDGSLMDVGRAVLDMEWKRFGITATIDELFDANCKRVRGSRLMNGGDIGYWSLCPNDTAETVFARITEVHQQTVDILQRMTCEQRDAWRRGEVSLADWVAQLEQATSAPAQAATTQATA